MRTALEMLDEKVQGKAIADRPERASFEEFLLKDAKVPGPGGMHRPFSFAGREALIPIVRLIDRVIDNKLADSTIAIAGGAQFGKTSLELNLMAYCTSQRFLAIGLFLPDKDLVDGVVDQKFRPDVIDQIPWFARMMSLGKMVNESGKAVDRKGAFTVTDGRRRSSGVCMGLQKPATTFSMDVASQDELDDIPPKYGKFVRGRMSASDLRLELRIGTQRINARGMNAAWKEGSQGVFELGGLNPEDHFPGIVRCQLGATPSPADPKLTQAGDFRHDADPHTTVAEHHPERTYYLAHTVTGEPLDRCAPVEVHRMPERIAMRNWSFRISQLSIDAISLSKIVAEWTLAVNDTEKMEVFRCDVLGLPQATAQKLSPFVIDRAQNLEPYGMRMKPAAGRVVYAGVDVGDKSWFIARERESQHRKRIIFATSMASSDLASRCASLFRSMGITCLFVDQRPEAVQARTLALDLNGLAALKEWPKLPDPLTGPGVHMRVGDQGLAWDGEKGQWKNLRCAVVRFDKKQQGGGIEHAFDEFDRDDKKMFVPLIKCNRQDSIDRVVRELLTNQEGEIDYIDNAIRTEPVTLLPRKGNDAVETMTQHFITGSERARQDKNNELGDYVDGCANHFLLANAYSALAEGEAIHGVAAPFFFEPVEVKNPRGGGAYAPYVVTPGGLLLT